jgi:hypothetical protein|tara:strand:- start:298 stop:477 length:180 start_codon:yes stop_codon:yes gene_type:complete
MENSRKQKLQDLLERQAQELKQLRDEQRNLRKEELRNSWEKEDKLKEKHLEQQFELWGL